MKIKLPTRLLFPAAVIWILGTFSAVNADEVPSNRRKTIPDAVERSEVIVVALFNNIEDERDSYTYFDSPVGSYEILELIKGKSKDKNISVYLDFGVPGEAKPTGWKYNRSDLPEKGSFWILFFPVLHKNFIHHTYGGSYGRLPYSEKNQHMIEKLLGPDKSARRGEVKSAAQKLNNRGVRLFHAGRYLDAIREYNIAINSYPFYSTGIANRGMAYEKLEQYDAALLDFNRAIRIVPNNPEYLYFRARLECKMLKFEEAERDLSEAISLRSDPDLYEARAFVRQKLDNQKGAGEDRARAEQLKSHSPLFSPIKIVGKDGEAYPKPPGYEQLRKRFGDKYFMPLSKYVYPRLQKAAALLESGKPRDGYKELIDHAQAEVNGKDRLLENEFHYVKGLCLQGMKSYPESLAEFALVERCEFDSTLQQKATIGSKRASQELPVTSEQISFFKWPTGRYPAILEKEFRTHKRPEIQE